MKRKGGERRKVGKRGSREEKRAEKRIENKRTNKEEKIKERRKNKQKDKKVRIFQVTDGQLNIDRPLGVKHLKHWKLSLLGELLALSYHPQSFWNAGIQSING